MSTKRPQLGELLARYNFFINPYRDVRFSRCPKCEGKTGQKKVPLMINVDPFYPISLNYTCRYCPKCDLLIAHKDEIEGNLEQIMSRLAPEAVGNDYLVMGTTERAFWKAGLDNPHPRTEILKNLHGFKEYLNFKRLGGWLPNKSAPKLPPAPMPDASIDNLKDVQKLVSQMQASMPLSARGTKDLLYLLRKQGVPISDRQTIYIRSAFYGGDEMGIGCDITPRGQDKRPIICSLTQMEILGNTPLAGEIRAYQQQRRAKLGR